MPTILPYESYSERFEQDLQNYVNDSPSSVEKIGRITLQQRAIDAAKNRSERLNLSGLSLTSLPSTLEHLTELEYLYLTENNLNSLPSWLEKMSKLRLLKIQHNPLTSIPDQIIENIGSDHPTGCIIIAGNNNFSAEEISHLKSTRSLGSGLVVLYEPAHQLAPTTIDEIVKKAPKEKREQLKDFLTLEVSSEFKTLLNDFSESSHSGIYKGDREQLMQSLCEITTSMLLDNDERTRCETLAKNVFAAEKTTNAPTNTTASKIQTSAKTNSL